MSVGADQAQVSVVFKRLHDRTKPLLLPNAWDAASARIFEDVGFPAIATTSAGVAYSLGFADGEMLGAGEMIAAIRRIARAVRVPVTADIESGYAADTQGLMRFVNAVRDAGAVGINLEDYGKTEERFFSIPEACERIAAIKREVGASLFVNARTDVFLRRAGNEGERLSLAIERLHAFVEAGADGVFVPGVSDQPTIAALAKSTLAPLNILADPRAPSLAELRDLGVARVSVGSSFMRRIMGETRHVATELLQTGRFDFANDPRNPTYDQANALFSR